MNYSKHTNPERIILSFVTATLEEKEGGKGLKEPERKMNNSDQWKRPGGF